MKILIVGGSASQLASAVRFYCDLSVFGNRNLPLRQL